MYQTTSEIDAAALIALGAECGCEFTAEDLQESAELSDEELDGIAGGAQNSHLWNKIVVEGSSTAKKILFIDDSNGNDVVESGGRKVVSEIWDDTDIVH